MFEAQDNTKNQTSIHKLNYVDQGNLEGESVVVAILLLYLWIFS